MAETMEVEASLGPDVSRAELRARKAAKKAAKRELREAHRLDNIAKSLATQAKHDSSLEQAAAEAATRALAAPVPERWRELVNDPIRQEAAHRCGLAVEALHRAARESERSSGAVGLPSTPLSGSPADALLSAMGKGTQTAAMFNPAACAGYLSRKFAERALLIFMALHQAERLGLPWVSAALLEWCHPSANEQQPPQQLGGRIVSIGGGPACCLYGCVLFEELRERTGCGERPASSTSAEMASQVTSSHVKSSQVKSSQVKSSQVALRAQAMPAPTASARALGGNGVPAEPAHRPSSAEKCSCPSPI